MSLVRGQDELPLEPKSFRLLQFLIENRDRVVGKEEIFRVVWEETAVTDNALTRAIAQIRKALDDDPKRPRYIETIPTVGYRFIAPLDRDAPATPPTPVLRKGPPVLALSVVAIAILVGIAAIFATWRLRKSAPLPPMSRPLPFTTYRGIQYFPSFSRLEGTQRVPP